MGQMTTAIMYAVEQVPPSDFEEGWYTLIEEYKEKRCRLHAAGEDSGRLLGFYVAVGASGEEGVPVLVDCQLSNIAEAASYAPRIALVVKERDGVDKLARKMGVELGPWLLWIVQVEVA